MSLYPSKFLFKDEVEKSGVEFSDPRRRGCDIHGVLSSSQDVVSLLDEINIVLVLLYLMSDIDLAWSDTRWTF